MLKIPGPARSCASATLFLGIVNIPVNTLNAYLAPDQGGGYSGSSFTLDSKTPHGHNYIALHGHMLAGDYLVAFWYQLGPGAFISF